MNQSPVLLSAGIEFIAEDRLDIDYQIKESLKKQGMAAVVIVPELKYLGHNGTSEAYQLDDLTIQFVEYTPINRAKNKASVVTGLDLATYTSELLGGPNAVIGFGKLCPNGIEQGEDGGLLVTKLTFRTYIENGDTGPIIYVPFVTKEELSAAIEDLSATVDSRLSNAESRWGNITGDLSDQTDLKNALDAKADSTDLEPYALSADVDSRLTAKADLTAIGDATVTINQDGVQKAQFTLNQKNNVTVNLEKGDEASWGNITGEISAQTDLKQELDNRYTVIATWSE